MTAGTAARDVDDDALGDDGRRRSRRALVAAALAVLLLVGFGTWLVAFSPAFGVRTVQVRGARTVTAAQVEAAARVPHGRPLLRLDTDAIRNRVEQLPDVASARITTSFPSSVQITVTERVAMGVVKAHPGYLLVDRTGDQFRRVPQRPRGLPLFAVPDGSTARATGRAVATVAAALPPRIRARIASIQALDPDAITLLLRNGRVVRWGSASRSADKARILPALLHQRAEQFDLTDPDQPFSR
jgi:cell division protein FtsQ